MPNEIPVVFHNGSYYDYHFIIKETVNDFEGNFECLGENIEIYKNYKKVTKIDNHGNESVITSS